MTEFPDVSEHAALARLSADAGFGRGSDVHGAISMNESGFTRTAHERRDAEVPWVTASAVGQATYCPYQLYLAHGGAERDERSEAALAAGTAVHEDWNARRLSGSSRGVVAVLRAALALAVVAALVLLVIAFAGAFGTP